jgi:hypothetical protein
MDEQRGVEIQAMMKFVENPFVASSLRGELFCKTSAKAKIRPVGYTIARDTL